MTVVLLPLLLIGPVFVLAAALVALAAHGPLGWLAGLALLVGLGAASRTCWRRGCAWWASTKAPVRSG